VTTSDNIVDIKVVPKDKEDKCGVFTSKQKDRSENKGDKGEEKTGNMHTAAALTAMSRIPHKGQV
jgi:hypothetical protein